MAGRCGGTRCSGHAEDKAGPWGSTRVVDYSFCMGRQALAFPPAGTQPSTIELHDSAFSGGVTVLSSSSEK